MTTNIFIGTPDWNAWLAEIRRTKKLYVKAFAPPQVVLDEKNTFSLKGIFILKSDVEATEEVGNRAGQGQILYWYGDHAPADLPVKTAIWNGYDARRNVYLLQPDNAELFTQAELDMDAPATLQRFDAMTVGQV